MLLNSSREIRCVYGGTGQRYQFYNQCDKSLHGNRQEVKVFLNKVLHKKGTEILLLCRIELWITKMPVRIKLCRTNLQKIHIYEAVTFSTNFHSLTYLQTESQKLQKVSAKMTSSLSCFVGDLIRLKNETAGSSYIKILIVDDNAQLSQENRMNNSMIFVNPSSCHLDSRWCSQPSLSSNSKQISSPSLTSADRRSSCTGLSSNKAQPNATWDNVSTKSNFFQLDATDCSVSSRQLFSVNPETKRALTDLNAPRVPRRSSSPGSLKPAVQRKKMLDGATRSSLRNALGGMAPQVSSTDGKKTTPGKKSGTSSKARKLPEEAKQDQVPFPKLLRDMRIPSSRSPMRSRSWIIDWLKYQHWELVRLRPSLLFLHSIFVGLRRNDRCGLIQQYVSMSLVLHFSGLFSLQ